MILSVEALAALAPLSQLKSTTQDSRLSFMRNTKKSVITMRDDAVVRLIPWNENG